MTDEEKGILIARAIDDYNATVKSLQCKCTRARQLSESAARLSQRLEAASKETHLVGQQEPIVYTTEEEVSTLESGIKEGSKMVLRLERELRRLGVPSL